MSALIWTALQSLGTEDRTPTLIHSYYDRTGDRMDFVLGISNTKHEVSLKVHRR